MAVASLAAASASLLSSPAGPLSPRSPLLSGLRTFPKCVGLGLQSIPGYRYGARASMSSNRRRMQEPIKPPPPHSVYTKLDITVEVNPPAERLAELGVPRWKFWECKASKFPWKYDQGESCYLTHGKVRVYPDGANDYVQFEAGDIAVFPKGMSCTWDCLEAVEKYYTLHP